MLSSVGYVMDYSDLRKQLVKDLKKQGYLFSPGVEEAMFSVPRELFVPSEKRKFAYADQPLEIGFGQTISAPHMVAIMCEALDLIPGMKVLEIGTGSGYHAAVVSSIIGKQGQVYSIERFSELADQAEKKLRSARIKNVTVIKKDGSLGLEQFAPYDRIYVTCSAPDVPSSLKNQICLGGKIVIPIGKVLSKLKVLTRTNKGFDTINKCSCAFVPLIGKQGF